MLFSGALLCVSPPAPSFTTLGLAPGGLEPRHRSPALKPCTEAWHWAELRAARLSCARPLAQCVARRSHAGKEVRTRLFLADLGGSEKLTKSEAAKEVKSLVIMQGGAPCGKGRPARARARHPGPPGGWGRGLGLRVSLCSRELLGSRRGVAVPP